MEFEKLISLVNKKKVSLLKVENKLSEIFEKPISVKHEKSGFGIYYDDEIIISTKIDSIKGKISVIFFRKYDKNEYYEYLKILINILKKYKFDYIVRNSSLKTVEVMKELQKSNEVEIDWNGYDERICEDTAHRFYNILNPKSKYYKKGILIYFNSELIGLYKFGTFFGSPTSEVILCFDSLSFKKFYLIFLQDKIIQKLNMVNKNKFKDFRRVNIKGNKMPIVVDGNKLEKNKNARYFLDNFEKIKIESEFTRKRKKRFWEVWKEDEIYSSKFAAIKMLISLFDVCYKENKKIDGKFDDVIELDKLESL